MSDVLDELDRACAAAGCVFHAYASAAAGCAWEGIVLIIENRAPGYREGRPAVSGGEAAGMATADAAIAAAARSALDALARRQW